jgi:hypothetical protein
MSAPSSYSVPVGGPHKLVIEGEVLKVTVREYTLPYGGGVSATLKVTVKDDRGFVVWGTLPAAIEQVARGAAGEQWHDKETIEWLKGKRVRFTATVEAREAGFGVFKRPSKGEVL